MKKWIRRISFSLMLSLSELLLGLLLLINPTGLTDFVIVLIGILMLAGGIYHLFRYIRLPREEAASTWKLSSGAALLAAGIYAVISRHSLEQILGTLTTLFGLVVMAAAFMKLQISVDAWRGKRPFWYLMVISFLLTDIQAMLLLINPYSESSVWIFNGIALILLSLLDCAYFILGKIKKPHNVSAEADIEEQAASAQP
ncbi:MAG: DUF308 domain-containing protein [Clostridia bacterium]|nr:DUF308 domain-containing protein [Clostridia bacterium]